MATSTMKICSKCGMDLNGQKRVKDSAGAYFCPSCWACVAKASGAERAGRPTNPIPAQVRAPVQSLVEILPAKPSPRHLVPPTTSAAIEPTSAPLPDLSVAAPTSTIRSPAPAKIKKPLWIRIGILIGVIVVAGGMAIAACFHFILQPQNEKIDQTLKDASAQLDKTPHVDAIPQWQTVQPHATETIEVTYDKFKDRTVVGTKLGAREWRMLYADSGGDYQYWGNEDGPSFYTAMKYYFDGEAINERPKTVELILNFGFAQGSTDLDKGIFFATNTGEEASFLLDGRSLQTKITGTFAKDEVFIELPSDLANALSVASSAEMEVSGWRFKFTAFQLAEFHKLLTQIGVAK